MRKIVWIFLVTAFVFTGCQTLKEWGEAMYEEQHSYDNYVQRNGVATSSYTLADGTTVYSYVRECVSSRGEEETLIYVDQNRRITDIKTIRTCPQK